MEVGGYDRGREAWEVRAGALRGWVPEALVRADAGRPPHEDVYRWLDRHGRQIEAALAARARGQRPRPPFDAVDLEE